MFHKTNFFFHRTLHNFKSSLYQVCKKLPRRPFSCIIFRSKSVRTENLYTGLLNIVSESDIEKATDGPLLEQIQEGEVMKLQAPSRSWRRERDRETFEEKMKELDMIETGDIENALDVEEALHYYSRLRSPVYIDIVDKFFADFYYDLSVPHASPVGAKTSKQRVGPATF